MTHVRIEITPLLTEMSMARFEDDDQIILQVAVHESPNAGQVDHVGSCRVEVGNGSTHYYEFSDPFPRIYDDEGKDTEFSQVLHQAIGSYVAGFRKTTSYVWVDCTAKEEFIILPERRDT